MDAIRPPPTPWPAITAAQHTSSSHHHRHHRSSSSTKHRRAPPPNRPAAEPSHSRSSQADLPPLPDLPPTTINADHHHHRHRFLPPRRPSSPSDGHLVCRTIIAIVFFLIGPSSPLPDLPPLDDDDEGGAGTTLGLVAGSKPAGGRRLHHCRWLVLVSQWRGVLGGWAHAGGGVGQWWYGGRRGELVGGCQRGSVVNGWAVFGGRRRCRWSAMMGWAEEEDECFWAARVLICCFTSGPLDHFYFDGCDPLSYLL
ncbi:hypothetical protein Dimus_031024 [Dionaea muscipula]